MIKDANELIALDLGQVRTGVARASSVARLPEPLKTIPTEEVVEFLRAETKHQGLKTVVVGLPRNLSGGETAQTAWVRHWVEQARTELPAINFHFQDEALTTVAVGKNVTDIDAAAASIILQDFLNSKEANAR